MEMSSDTSSQKQTVEEEVYEKEKMGLIERDIKALLQSKVGDLCILDNYDAYYGGTYQSVPHGIGVLRMNENFIIHSTWNHGIIDGDLIAFDVPSKRLVAFMKVEKGMIKSISDVNKKDTLNDIRLRRCKYQGNDGIIEKETWDMPTSHGSMPNTHIPFANRKKPPSFFVPNEPNLEDFIDPKTGIMSVSQYTFCDVRAPFVLDNKDTIRELYIKQSCYTVSSGFCCEEVPNLERIVMGFHCFGEHREEVRKSEPDKKFIIRNCPKLKCCSIDEASFYEFKLFRLVSIFHIQVVNRLPFVRLRIGWIKQFCSLLGS